MFAEQVTSNLREIFSKYGDNVLNIFDVKDAMYKQFAASIT
jgi:hypothetical protein